MGDLASIDWSPDDKYIAAGLRNTDSVYVFDSATGKTISKHPGKDSFGTITNPSWSPDSQRIAVHSKDGIHIWDAVTGKQIAIYKNGWNPVWSPNGKYIAVVSGDVDAPNNINILDAATGKVLYTYTGHRYDVSVIAWSPASVYIASGERLLTTSDGSIGRTGIVRVWVARP
jgi:WD40 repeat protein